MLLAMAYASGQGAPKDKEKAVYWYQKAADQGNAAAQKALQALSY